MVCCVAYFVSFVCIFGKENSGSNMLDHWGGNIRGVRERSINRNKDHVSGPMCACAVEATDLNLLRRFSALDHE